VVLLGDRDEVALLNAELSHLLRAFRADIHAEHLALPARPLEIRLFPAFWQLEHSRMHAIGGMNERGMSEEVRQNAAALAFQLQAAIGKDGTYLIADLIHVSDHGNPLGAVA
jgi:hypothetical protein